MSLPAAILREYDVLTKECGLLDRSARGKLAVDGADRASFLDSILANDVSSLAAGSSCWAAFLTPKGKLLGTVRILAADDDPELGDSFLLDTDRATIQSLFDTLHHYHVGYKARVHKRTIQYGLFSLIGPASGEVTAAIVGRDLPNHTGAHCRCVVEDIELRLVRTREGLDIFFPDGSGPALRAMLAAAGAQPVNEEAAEVIRVERGQPRWGMELDDSVLPHEAGLDEEMISFTKGCYVGQETVARLHYKGRANRHLCGLLLLDPLPQGTSLHLDEKEVGHLGTAVISPRMGEIALALLRREVCHGTILTTEEGASAIAVKLPFRCPRTSADVL